MHMLHRLPSWAGGLCNGAGLQGCRGVNAEEARVTCIGRALRRARSTTKQGQAGHRGTVTRPPKALCYGATPCAMRLVGVIGRRPLRATCLINVTRPRTARQSDTAAPPNALLSRARTERACLIQRDLSRLKPRSAEINHRQMCSHRERLVNKIGQGRVASEINVLRSLHLTPCYQRDGCRHPSDPCARVHQDRRGILFLVPRPKTPMYAQIVMTFVTKKQQQEYHACSSRIVREPDMKPTYHKQMTFTCPTEDHRTALAPSTRKMGVPALGRSHGEETSPS
jgi:hypothetical protein